MQIAYTIDQDVMAIELPERLDHESLPRLDQILSDWRSQSGRDTLVDFCHVAYASSSGLQVLVRHEKAARQGSGRLILASVRATVFQVFEISALAHMFTFAETRQEGMEILRPAPKECSEEGSA